jgi:RNA polymerase sigma-70 factor (ECF subfamily)
MFNLVAQPELMNLDFDLYWKRIQNNEENALEEIYKLSFRSLVIYSTGIIGKEELAEEAVQDVLLKIWENRKELAINGSFRAYLFQSVHNHTLNMLRHQKTGKESVNQSCSESIWKFISETYDINDNIIDRMFSSDTELLVEQTIIALPEQCRKIFQMSRFDSLKNDEIAARLGLSENTVKTHIYKALQKITMALKKEK